MLDFYTDVFGLPVTITGMLLLFTRFLDAIDAPIWGSIIDHTHSKYGRSRPFFLWLAIPFAVTMWLTFTTPSFLSDTGKIVYAVFTYLLAGIVYSGVQTAITSILPNLTSNHSERMILNTFRMVGGSVGAFISMTFTLPLVNLLGGGDQQLGFSITVGMFGVIVVILLFFAFRHLREQNVERNVSIPVKDSVRAIKNNWPWIILVTVNLFVPTVRSPATSDSWVAILPSDLLVSRRQKHNGTSWTRFGSTGPALVTALVLNGYLDQWVLSRKVSFERPPLRHSAAAQMEVANQGVESLEAI